MQLIRIIQQFAFLVLGYLSDFVRYLFFSNMFHLGNSRKKLEASIIFNYHKIEKALAMPEVRAIFGKGYIPHLLSLLQKWKKSYGEENDIFRAAAVAVKKYNDHIRNFNGEKDKITIEIEKKVSHFLNSLSFNIDELNTGGVKKVKYPESKDEIMQASDTYKLLVESRASVRRYIDKEIKIETVNSAISLALNCPSACNRQPWRIRIFDKTNKADILNLQKGNQGFGHLADKVFLITGDLNTCLSEKERKQVYVDCGMFAMNLVLALHSKGIGTCCLNCYHSFAEDIKFRRKTKIGKNEVPIMMISAGYAEGETVVPASHKYSVNQILCNLNI